MSTFKRVLPVSALLIIVVGGVLVVGCFIGGLRFPHDDVGISRLSLCTTADLDSGIPQEDVSKIPSTYSALYACGYLQTTRPVPLHIYLYKDNTTLPLYSGDIENIEGEFSEELPLPTRDRVGSYRVDIYYFRKLLFSQTFVVVDP